MCWQSVPPENLMSLTEHDVIAAGVLDHFVKYAQPHASLHARNDASHIVIYAYVLANRP